MKKVLLHIVLLVQIIFGLQAQTNPTTKVEFEKTMHEFGEIREVDGAVSYVFRYKNIGDKPFVIYDISTSCGCTTPSYDRSPMRSGETRELTVKFDPTNQPGRVEKTIYVRGNVENGTLPLKIRALIEPRPRTVEDDYPVPLSDGVRLQDVVIEAGLRANSKPTTVTLGVVNTSKNVAKLTVNKNFNYPDWVKISLKDEQLQPNQKSQIIVTLEPQGKDLWGRKSFVVPLAVNGRGQFMNVTGTVVFVEDFEGKTGGEQPRAVLNNSFYHFSTVKVGTAQEQTFVLENKGTKELYIRSIDHSSAVSSSPQKTALKPNETTEIKLKLETSKAGAKSEIVRVITNDPVKPVIEIRLMANVVEK